MVERYSCSAKRLALWIFSILTVLANIMLDGILPENLTLPETHEPVPVLDRKAPHPARGSFLVRSHWSAAD